MIKGIGTDIIEIRRVEAGFRKMGWAFAHRVLGPKELEVFGELLKEDTIFNKPSSNYLARRFAAKEALIKAADNPRIDMRQCQVLNTKTGKPFFYFSGELIPMFNNPNTEVHVSISDNHTTVVASVVIGEK